MWGACCFILEVARTHCQRCNLFRTPGSRPLHTAASPCYKPPCCSPQRVKTHSPTPFLRLMVDLLMFFADTYRTVFKVRVCDIPGVHMPMRLRNDCLSD